MDISKGSTRSWWRRRIFAGITST